MAKDSKQNKQLRHGNSMTIKDNFENYVESISMFSRSGFNLTELCLEIGYHLEKRDILTDEWETDSHISYARSLIQKCSYIGFFDNSGSLEKKSINLGVFY